MICAIGDVTAASHIQERATRRVDADLHRGMLAWLLQVKWIKDFETSKKEYVDCTKWCLRCDVVLNL